MPKYALGMTGFLDKDPQYPSDVFKSIEEVVGRGKVFELVLESSVRTLVISCSEEVAEKIVSWNLCGAHWMSKIDENGRVPVRAEWQRKNRE